MYQDEILFVVNPDAWVSRVYRRTKRFRRLAISDKVEVFWPATKYERLDHDL